ncbi:MAG: glycogen-binding domain-containing protein [Gemmatimonadaceae bacterium]
MQQVRKDARSFYPFRIPTTPWWKKEHVLRISPFGALALAAGFGAIVALSSIALARGPLPNAIGFASTSQSHPDTVTLVRFVFAEPGATRVELVGDFNQWTRGMTLLQPTGVSGVWAASVPVTPGRHEYAFIVNGSRWMADPLAPKSSDDFGTESSVIRVGGQSPTT